MKLTLTYRTRRRLRRLGVTLGYLALVTALVLVCWFVWLDRYVVYSGNEAHLDFDWESHEDEAVVALPPEEVSVPVFYNEGEDMVNTSTELTPISGFYITLDDLLQSVDDVAAGIRQLPEGSAVMMDLKSPSGNFYYSSDVAKSHITDQLDVTAVDKLIKTLTRGDHYAIARVPAFRDRSYGLEHDYDGLPHSSRGYLWADEENVYWLNPASTGAMTYLISIANELRDLGFDEVVFDGFHFPATENIYFEGSQSEAITKAAQVLVSSCSTNYFAVSFSTYDRGFSLPDGRCRLYLTDVDAPQAQSVADGITLDQKDIRLAFLTDTNDTRFDAYNVIRPMPAAQVEE